MTEEENFKFNVYSLGAAVGGNPKEIEDYITMIETLSLIVGVSPDAVFEQCKKMAQNKVPYEVMLGFINHEGRLPSDEEINLIASFNEE